MTTLAFVRGLRAAPSYPSCSLALDQPSRNECVLGRPPSPSPGQADPEPTPVGQRPANALFDLVPPPAERTEARFCILTAFRPYRPDSRPGKPVKTLLTNAGP